MARTVKLVNKISNKGYPVHDKKYQSSHRYADKVEKKADPKAYKEINKMDRKLKPNELAGKHTKSGKIEINRKYTKNHDGISGKRIERNLALHERVEDKKQRIKK